MNRQMLIVTWAVFMVGCASIQNVPIPPTPKSYTPEQRKELCAQNAVTHHPGFVLPDQWEYQSERRGLQEMTPTFVMFPESREVLEDSLQWRNELTTYYAVAGGAGLLAMGAGVGDLVVNGADAGLPGWADGGLIGFGVGMLATAIVVHVMMPEDPLPSLATTYNASLCGR